MLTKLGAFVLAIAGGSAIGVLVGMVVSWTCCQVDPEWLGPIGLLAVFGIPGGFVLGGMYGLIIGIRIVRRHVTSGSK